MKPIASTIRLASRAGLAMICGVAVGGCAIPKLRTSGAEARAVARVGDDGTIHVPAFDLPESSLLSEESRAALKQHDDGDAWRMAEQACPPMNGAAEADMPAIRKCLADAYYTTPFYKRVRDRYDVVMTPEKIGGVYTEIFTPREGITRKNEKRVLINLHAGTFWVGSRTFSHLESIPIASVGKMKVISIDYRMWPEHTFPAASEDVAAVYRELLKTYNPENIGMYGCSAGGALTAQSMAWFQKEGLPLPGAIGMFCHGAEQALNGEVSKFARSDAAHFVGALSGLNYEKLAPRYYRGVDRRNPLASPGDYDGIMAKFPPSLLISSTRDQVLSIVAVTHAQLVRLGVEADLHVWEGMGHAFLHNPALPESRGAYDVIVKFFDKHLGM